MDKIKEKMPQILMKALANTYTLYYRSQAAHWNVEGQDFYQLHQLFQTIYEDAADAIDQIAERIRQYDEKLPLSLCDLLEGATLKMPKSGSDSHVETLYDIHTQLHEQWDNIATVAESVEDSATVDMAGKRAGVHAKFAWMLKAINKKD